MKNIVKTWKGSCQPRKQRKWIARAPLHARNALLSAPLLKSLREKMHTRNIPVRKGDKIKVLRGQFKGKIGNVLRVDTKKYNVFVEGVELVRKNGAKVLYGIHPSKVMIIEVHEDKRRFKHMKKENDIKAKTEKIQEKVEHHG